MVQHHLKQAGLAKNIKTIPLGNLFSPCGPLHVFFITYLNKKEKLLISPSYYKYFHYMLSSFEDQCLLVAFGSVERAFKVLIECIALRQS